MGEVIEVMKEIQSNPSILAAVVISGKSGNFIAGADITRIYLLYIELNFIFMDFLTIFINLVNQHSDFFFFFSSKVLTSGNQETPL